MGTFAKALREAARQDRRHYKLVIGDFVKDLYTHPITGKDTDWLIKRHPDGKNDPASTIVDMMIRKVEDEDGNKLFTSGDADDLKSIDIKILNRIQSALFDDDMDMSDEKIEAEEKN